jgi:predicted nuclease of predicted toxin-antitoxin system
VAKGETVDPRIVQEARCVSAPRFLVDENLSVTLPTIARTRGYEATHVNHHGLHQSKDWEIIKVLVEQDLVLVTNNAIEFRGRFERLEAHPGVVFLLPSVPRSAQIELFSAALDVIDQFPDMMNIALDVTYEGQQIRVDRYGLP